VVVTAFITDGEGTRAKQVLAKPFNLEILLETVQRWCAAPYG